MMRSNIDPSVFTQAKVRDEFKAWLVEQHPDWGASTVHVRCSGAYYLYNNDCGITLAEALTADDGFRQAHDAIERYFTTRSSNPTGAARGYLRCLHLLKEFLTEKHPVLLNGSGVSGAETLQSVLAIMSENYASGFRFDTTALRLLSSKAGVEISEDMQSQLKQVMFRRSDNVYFLLDVVADAETRQEIVDCANALLDEYGCFEISELYVLYAARLNPKCIGGADDFEKFYEGIGNRDVRCVAAPQMGNRIARHSNGNVWNSFYELAQKIITATNEEFDGVVSEESLHKKFHAFSTDLLAKIIKRHLGNELIRVEINEIVCYQTLDGLGLPYDFSDTLFDTLCRLDDLGLESNEEILHTALSLALGVNFKDEYNIPDQATYRRLIDTYYKGAPLRDWKYGVFGKVAS